jgi:hypothetical protein
VSIGVIALVADRGLHLEALNEVMSEGEVVALTGAADQADGKSKRIGGGMDLVLRPSRNRPRPWASAPLFLRAPAAC